MCVCLQLNVSWYFSLVKPSDSTFPILKLEPWTWKQFFCLDWGHSSVGDMLANVPKTLGSIPSTTYNQVWWFCQLLGDKKRQEEANLSYIRPHLKKKINVFESLSPIIIEIITDTDWTLSTSKKPL